MFMGVLLFTYCLHTDSRKEGVASGVDGMKNNSYQTSIMYQNLYNPARIKRVEPNSPYKCADRALNPH